MSQNNLKSDFIIRAHFIHLMLFFIELTLNIKIGGKSMQI